MNFLKVSIKEKVCKEDFANPILAFENMYSMLVPVDECQKKSNWMRTLLRYLQKSIEIPQDTNNASCFLENKSVCSLMKNLFCEIS